MTEDTQIVGRQHIESKAFGVSIRAWIALIIIETVCLMSVMKIEIKEPLYTLAGLVIGFYFAQKEKPKP